jgi:hypothetical protein
MRIFRSFRGNESDFGRKKFFDREERRVKGEG